MGHARRYDGPASGESLNSRRDRSFLRITIDPVGCSGGGREIKLPWRKAGPLISSR